ncbi:carbohydrate ABC transporter permease [Lapidilactobacillus bayanensis]|uniref:carbohydrate ABC transporter permease n=1 Tax=Lapidilactobacillus bayanensis TaxID=2485998 RepID=UPI000F7A8D23|nr:carbohydrate ABC transporter permease [Lapidilactobacillus bayanensis]
MNNEADVKLNHQKIHSRKVGMYVCLILLALVSFAPFYLMLTNATRSTGDIVSGFSFFPGNNIAQNFREIQQRVDVIAAFKNSLIISGFSTLLTCYFSALTAYGFVAYDFRGKGVIFTILLVIMMIPGQVSIVGFYKMCKGLNMVNTFWPLILPSISSATTVFFIKQYAETALSRSAIESARIDGASEFMIFNRIGLPMLSPAIFTMGITGFIASWNNYMMPLILLSDPKKFTLPLIIRALNADAQDRTVGGMYLAIAISVVPIMIVFFMFSRYIIDGVNAGGDKG